MRDKSRFRSFNALVTMRIGGEVVYKLDAKYLYRCAECLGPLKEWNNGLACVGDDSHRYFVHKRDVAAIEAIRANRLNEVNANYEIVDGVLRPKKELIQCQ